MAEARTKYKYLTSGSHAILRFLSASSELNGEPIKGHLPEIDAVTLPARDQSMQRNSGSKVAYIAGGS